MESESTGVMLFFVNYGYMLIVYKALLIDSIYIQGAIIRVEELKTLYQELVIDIKFII